MPTRLKLIELQGFKTFASRTEFAFSDTITAIVGPNGSGKSNIADAIRWVLGEQTYSLLRAKKTEDMIFSGSEHRSRSGMALANIVFDNSDGWLPIDFSEVAITRRAYRDGQNEYLINGQRVRLKDISELLAQSGLSERTYTIIGQGLVDAALALKAEERRRLFEEAAGIGLHRSRREEAIRRLESTRRNSERVQDILAELNPRLRSLERQAKRVEEYERVQADLHLLLRDWYGYHWHLAQKEFAEAQATVKTQEKHLRSARDDQDQQGNQLTTITHEIQKQRELLGQWHNHLSGLHAQREKLSRELVVIEERIRSYTDQSENVKLEINRIENETGFQIELINNAKADSVRMQSELEEIQSSVNESKTSLKLMEDEKGQVEQTVQKIQQAIGTLTAQQSHLKARISERNNTVEQYQKQLMENEQKIGEIKKNLYEMNLRSETIGSDLAAAQENVNAVEKKINFSNQKLQDFEADRRNRSEKANSLLVDITRIEAQLDVLVKAEMNYIGYAEGAKFLMKGFEGSNQLEVLGILSSMLEVSKRYEMAIAAALGEFLDLVIFKGKDQLEGILSQIENGQPRSAILPLDKIQIPKDHDELNDEATPSYIALAADLVTVSDNLYQVVNLLLKNTVVVENRRDAQLWMQYLTANDNFDFKIVTLLGEVFYPTGQVTAGLAQSSAGLSRSREKRELQARVEDLRLDLGEMEKVLASLEHQINTERNLLSEFQKNHTELSTAAKDNLDRYNQARLEIENHLRNVRFLEDNNKRLTQELERQLPEIKGMNNEVERLDRKLEESRHLLRDKRNLLSGLSLDEQQAAYSHWQTRLAVTKQSYADINQKVNELQAVIQRAEQSKLILVKKLDDYHVQSNALVQRKQEINRDEEHLQTEIHQYTEKINPVENKLKILEEQYAHLQGLESESRKTLTLAEHQFAQARITFARHQEALESLRRRIEDDFGLVAFRYEESISGPNPLPLDGFVENLPFASEIPHDLEENVKRYRAQLRRIGPVNPEIQIEYIQVRDRFNFLTEQVTDLKKAEEDLKEVIAELDLLMDREFRRTFEAVAHEFRQIFSRLFGGGSARLVLTDPDDLTDTGIDIEARLPGRREQGLSLLSGGERSLTAAALVFSLLKVSPTPFCVLDEVDAMLDEANVGRYRELLRELGVKTQFVVITHNRNTVQAADVIYGVTMGSDSTSQVISLRLDDVSKVV